MEMGCIRYIERYLMNTSSETEILTGFIYPSRHSSSKFWVSSFMSEPEHSVISFDQLSGEGST
jgi:hypothetical protein